MEINNDDVTVKGLVKRQVGVLVLSSFSFPLVLLIMDVLLFSSISSFKRGWEELIMYLWVMLVPFAGPFVALTSALDWTSLYLSVLFGGICIGLSYPCRNRKSFRRLGYIGVVIWVVSWIGIFLWVPAPLPEPLPLVGTML